MIRFFIGDSFRLKRADRLDGQVADVRSTYQAVDVIQTGCAASTWFSASLMLAPSVVDQLPRQASTHWSYLSIQSIPTGGGSGDEIHATYAASQSSKQAV
jgi:hypothetical protein